MHTLLLSFIPLADKKKLEHCKISYKTFLPEDLISKGKKILLNSMIEENHTSFENIFTINIFTIPFYKKNRIEHGGQRSVKKQSMHACTSHVLL